MAAAAQCRTRPKLDGELVVWEDDQLTRERLQGRLQHRGDAAAQVVDERPAHLIAFDLLRLSGADMAPGPNGAAGRYWSRCHRRGLAGGVDTVPLEHQPRDRA
ncbi:hypothetical protein [Streptomyces fagopyri]|uniref:hypothetical protein n=1 Tax=Streptomyces fagopyri TaxID=2662397 RepID=UPI0033C0BA94